MAKRRATLPKDFEALLEKGDLTALKSVFEKCDINARGGYSKQTTLAWPECPDEFTRWLVANGADLQAEDTYGEPALTKRAWHWKGGVEILLALGADVHHGEGERGTALHAAADHFRVAAARTLLNAGARVDALDKDGLTPLERALKRCDNANIADMAPMADVLLNAGAKKTPRMTEEARRIGKNFEFHRAGYNPETRDEADAGLKHLYELFGATPVAARRMHDGIEPIIAKSAAWEDAHQELWEWLVPSSGAAESVQGEVIRLSRKIHREIYHNGSANWDTDFDAMAQSLATLLASGAALSEAALHDVARMVQDLNRNNAETERLCEFAVDWVRLNPKPVKLPPPKYKR